VGEAAREWVFLVLAISLIYLSSAKTSPYQEVEHGKELPRWHVHMVSEPATSSISNVFQKSDSYLP
jgi:uncharacterized cysteine cluster protein YcgN (CxxCxxCC family)